MNGTPAVMAKANICTAAVFTLGVLLRLDCSGSSYCSSALSRFACGSTTGSSVVCKLVPISVEGLPARLLYIHFDIVLTNFVE